MLVAEVNLNEPSIRTLIGEGEAASEAQKVGMCENGQGCCGEVFSGSTEFSTDNDQYL